MVDQNLHPHPHLTILKFSTASRMAGKIMVSKPKMKMPEAKFPSNVRISSLGMGPWGWLVWGLVRCPVGLGKLWKTMENLGHKTWARPASLYSSPTSTKQHNVVEVMMHSHHGSWHRQYLRPLVQD